MGAHMTLTTRLIVAAALVILGVGMMFFEQTKSVAGYVLGVGLGMLMVTVI